MVWGQHYLIIILPCLCLVSSTGKSSISSANVASFDSQFSLVFKIINIHQEFMGGSKSYLNLHSQVLYATFNLATTLLCTLLIIYRILSIGQVATSGAGARLRAYQRVIEVLVESSAFYSVCMVTLVACFASDNWGEGCADIIATIARVWKSYSLYNIFIHE